MDTLLINLPDDMILKVFSCLGFSDKLALSSVNKKLHSVLKGERAWGEVRIVVNMRNYWFVRSWLSKNWQVNLV